MSYRPKSPHIIMHRPPTPKKSPASKTRLNNNLIAVTIGERIKDHRLQSKCSNPSSFAKLLGVSRLQLNGFETGRIIPEYEILKKAIGETSLSTLHQQYPSIYEEYYN